MSDEHMITGETRDSFTDCSTVLWFSEEMIKKLRKNSHKAHWSTVDCDYLFGRFLEEVEELKKAREGELPINIIRECADAGNFLMMIADNVKNGKG